MANKNEGKTMGLGAEIAREGYEMVIIMDMQRRHIQRLKSFPREQRTQDFMAISGGDFNEGAEVL